MKVFTLLYMNNSFGDEYIFNYVSYPFQISVVIVISMDVGFCKSEMRRAVGGPLRQPQSPL